MVSDNHDKTSILGSVCLWLDSILLTDRRYFGQAPKSSINVEGLFRKAAAKFDSSETGPKPAEPKANKEASVAESAGTAGLVQETHFN